MSSDQFKAVGIATFKGIGKGAKKLGQAGHETYKKNKAERNGTTYVPPQKDDKQLSLSQRPASLEPEPEQPYRFRPLPSKETLQSYQPPPKRNVGAYSIPERGGQSKYATAVTATTTNTTQVQPSGDVGVQQVYSTTSQQQQHQQFQSPQQVHQHQQQQQPQLVYEQQPPRYETQPSYSASEQSLYQSQPHQSQYEQPQPQPLQPTQPPQPQQPPQPHPLLPSRPQSQQQVQYAVPTSQLGQQGSASQQQPLPPPSYHQQNYNYNNQQPAHIQTQAPSSVPPQAQSVNYSAAQQINTFQPTSSLDLSRVSTNHTVSSSNSYAAPPNYPPTQSRPEEAEASPPPPPTPARRPLPSPNSFAPPPARNPAPLQQVRTNLTVSSPQTTQSNELAPPPLPTRKSLSLTPTTTASTYQEKVEDASPPPPMPQRKISLIAQEIENLSINKKKPPPPSKPLKPASLKPQKPAKPAALSKPTADTPPPIKRRNY